MRRLGSFAHGVIVPETSAVSELHVTTILFLLWACPRLDIAHSALAHDGQVPAKKLDVAGGILTGGLVVPDGLSSRRGEKLPATTC